jgi:NADH-quinone oxidoreductase subunit L
MASVFKLLWLIAALPFAGFVVLAVVGKRLSQRSVSSVGLTSVGLSAFLALVTAVQFISAPPPGQFYGQTLWTWVNVSELQPGIGFRLDALSLIFVLVVTFVAFLIHLYSSEFMRREEGYSRFFAYMNLFVGFMLTLVLADNLLLLYLGWEGVGLCSYLLIGFWYKDPANGRAARKAFIVTRVGDTALAIGLFLLFTNLGTLDIQGLMENASQRWAAGSSLAVAAAALLLGGAVGKSAQLPLQTWLPDAMAGPTPVSALIHAATMVTAGVYLIARTHTIFELAPVVQLLVAVIGALTLLVSGFSALVQVDIKRVLAYSTISQIGYMFLAMGVGAWPAAIFHFMTHAFFKALLFLGAGVIILGLHHEHNMFKMGGLRKQIPAVFWTFLIGASSLAALPLVTAGFYSKESILWAAWASDTGSLWLWAAGLLGAFLTVLYSFRMVFITFFGEEKMKIDLKPGLNLKLPLLVLAFLSVFAGFVEIPRALGDFPLLSDFLHSIFPATVFRTEALNDELLLQIISSTVVLVGLYLAYIFFLGKPFLIQLRLLLAKTTMGKEISRFFFSGWGFDWFYDRLLVKPYEWLARINRNDVVDLPYQAIAAASSASYRVLSRTQTGLLRWYAAAIVIGAIIILTVMVFL